MLQITFGYLDTDAFAAPPLPDMTGLTVSRWRAAGPGSRQSLETAPDEYLFSLCLRATRLEFRSGASASLSGIMRAGALHVTGPSRQIVARFDAACDIVHLHIATALLQARVAKMGAAPEVIDGLDGWTLSDSLVEQLTKLLLSKDATADTLYANAIAQTLITRILHLAHNRAPVGALAKWRLRRVQTLVEARLDEALTLSEMAAAAGLSRMHFAAQFRAATGSSPHEYLLCRRIEEAKRQLAATDTPLAEIALNVGFQAQAHFTTVFKRLAGEPPARWRRACRDANRDMAGILGKRPDLPARTEAPYEGARA